MRGGILVNTKLSDSEIMVMDILWRIGEARATLIADAARDEIGWEKNTTYTFLHRLIKKGAVKRRDPGFICSAVHGKDEILRDEAADMVERLYDGSIGMFVQAFLDKKPISQAEKNILLKLIDSGDVSL
ncbi:MAG: BlaI/MecI/CopY family transcriptional regulator [Defluviitaleaceae bacterium]|nr:BlaI/MecI/CopY family transcriptional regulator [Defluviitaleaceae bacterium]